MVNFINLQSFNFIPSVILELTLENLLQIHYLDSDKKLEMDLSCVKYRLLCTYNVECGVPGDGLLLRASLALRHFYLPL